MIDEKRFSQYYKTFETLQNGKKENQNSFRPQKKGKQVDLFAGVDEVGNYAISIISNNSTLEVSSTTLISVKKLDYSTTKEMIIFSLSDELLLSIFISFAIDLENVIESDELVSSVEIYNRYLYWQKMFKTVSDGISESTVKGLINELYLMEKYMIPKYGITEAIKGWVGTEGVHKDFAYADGLWYEVKAINSGKITVPISSIEQLQAETTGLLIISELEKTSSQNTEGIRLYELVNRIRESIEVDNIKMIFLEKIFSLGFTPEIFSETTYKGNTYRYIITGDRCYEVKEGFPRLTRDQLSSAFGLISYEIIISEIEKFKVEFY